MTNDVSTEPLVTLGELAGRLSVSTRTLRRWREHGMPTYSVGATVRFRVSEVEAWMRGTTGDDKAAA